MALNLPRLDCAQGMRHWVDPSRPGWGAGYRSVNAKYSRRGTYCASPAPDEGGPWLVSAALWSLPLLRCRTHLHTHLAPCPPFPSCFFPRKRSTCTTTQPPSSLQSFSPSLYPTETISASVQSGRYFIFSFSLFFTLLSSLTLHHFFSFLVATLSACSCLLRRPRHARLRRVRSSKVATPIATSSFLTLTDLVSIRTKFVETTTTTTTPADEYHCETCGGLTVSNPIDWYILSVNANHLRHSPSPLAIRGKILPRQPRSPRLPSRFYHVGRCGPSFAYLPKIRDSKPTRIAPGLSPWRSLVPFLWMFGRKHRDRCTVTSQATSADTNVYTK